MLVLVIVSVGSQLAHVPVCVLVILTGVMLVVLLDQSSQEEPSGPVLVDLAEVLLVLDGSHSPQLEPEVVVLVTSTGLLEVEDHGSHALGSVLLLLLLLPLGVLLKEGHSPHDGSMVVSLTGLEEVVVDPHSLHVVSSLVVLLVTSTGLLVVVVLYETEVELDQPSHPSAETELKSAAVAAKVVAFILFVCLVQVITLEVEDYVYTRYFGI